MIFIFVACRYNKANLIVKRMWEWPSSRRLRAAIAAGKPSAWPPLTGNRYPRETPNPRLLGHARSHKITAAHAFSKAYRKPPKAPRLSTSPLGKHATHHHPQRPNTKHLTINTGRHDPTHIHEYDPRGTSRHRLEGRIADHACDRCWAFSSRRLPLNGS